MTYEMTSARRAATRLVSALLVVTLMSLAVLPSGARAQSFDDPMQYTLKSTVYGGILGGLLGTAMLFLSDNKDDHLGYIPTGVGVGMLLGAAYGVATSGIMYTSAVEVDDGAVALHLPKVDRVRLYDENTQETNVINKVDLFKVSF